MKRALAAIVFAGLFLGIPGQAFAQGGGGGFGIKGGLVWADLRGDDQGPGFDFERRSGFAAGAFFLLESGGLRLQPEFIYTRRGADLLSGFDVDDDVTSAKLQMDYLEVPLLVKLGGRRGPLTAGNQPVLFFGPYAAVQIDSKVVVDVGDQKDETDVSDVFEDLDYGIVLGLGMDFSKLGLEFRYTLGLRNLLVLDPDDDPFELKHTAFAIYGSWAF